MLQNFKNFILEQRNIDALIITLMISRPLIITLQSFIFEVIQPLINSYLKININKKYKFNNVELPLNLILLQSITSFVSILFVYNILKISKTFIIKK